MLYKVKEFVRNTIIKLFMSTKNDLTQLVENEVNLEDYNYKHIVNSSIIIKLSKDEQTFYFRECYSHFPLKKYIYIAIDEYFDFVCLDNEKDLIKTLVLNDIKQKSNFKKLKNLGSIFNKHLLEILAYKYENYEEVGLPSLRKINNVKIFIAFIQYINCVIINQKINNHLKKNQKENNSANKQLATYEFSRLLGIDYLIPKVQMSKLIYNNNVKYGTIMDNAEGIAPSELFPEQRKSYNKNTFLKELTTLEYFDALCYQLDHRLDNYNVVLDEQNIITHVIAFDNDANRTFFARKKFPTSTYAGVGCILNKKNMINRPYMDSDFSNKILDLQKNQLKKTIGFYLSKVQLNALWKRIKMLKKAINIEISNNKEFLIKNWENVDFEIASSNKYGLTYFNLYLNDTLMLDRKKSFAENSEE